MSNRFLSSTAKNLQPSGIRRFFDLAAGMEGVISLGVGEPDFVTSWKIREASILSLEEGYTSYTANPGILSLRKEISKYYRTKYSLSYDPNSEVLVTVGASQGIDLAIRAVVNPGEEVIVIRPSFVSYLPTIELAGGIPVPIETTAETDFRPTADAIRHAVTDRTKAVMICSPSNPTGTVLNQSSLQEIADVCIEKDLLVITDEIYAELSYDEAHVSIASLSKMRERTIVINGFSKGFAMTGWRLGFALGPDDILQAMLKIHQYTTMCASTTAQHGALEALRNGWEDVAHMRKHYQRRRNYIVRSFQEMGLSCHMPGGAFYAFPSIKSTGFSSEEFAEKLLHEEKVAVVPGNVFGPSGEGHIRCSYASSMEQLQEAVRRMEQFIARHSTQEPFLVDQKTMQT
ncbi:aminotransferase [Aureibacillus halotolerans]|uniref:Aminotransferase n=1 Tax=Aureibacillus halotolerans TaxID=1508390 RepID=A0A4R6U6B3_9BACI|nr:aminotransferase [Aureibacillus halotolerans]TDQ40403.1 aminotransferase [Aureibacillus halotolerans]